MFRCVFIGLILGLSGCEVATVVNKRIETVVDRYIDRAEQLTDKSMDTLDTYISLLERKAERGNTSRCKWPYTGLVRYALRGPKEAAIIKKYCNLVVTSPESTAGSPRL